MTMSPIRMKPLSTIDSAVVDNVNTTETLVEQVSHCFFHTYFLVVTGLNQIERVKQGQTGARVLLPVHQYASC